MFNENLARALDFTEDDLATNREGKLSTRQKEFLRRKAFSEIKDQPAVQRFGCFWLLLLVGLFVGAIGGDVVTVTVARLVVGLPVIILVFQFFRVWRHIGMDMDKGTVTSDTGKVSLKVGEYDHLLSFPNVAFAIGEDVLLAFHNDESYRIYYAPNTRVILSAEPMRDDN
jgi:hypothetical protein